MQEPADVRKHLPLTEATYYILLALLEPRHGYAVMQEVEKTSQGTVSIGAGTLYGAFSTLEKAGLIRKVSEEDRRKYYVVTPKGREVLSAQIKRFEIMAQSGRGLVLQK